MVNDQRVFSIPEYLMEEIIGSIYLSTDYGYPVDSGVHLKTKYAKDNSKNITKM